MCISKPYLKNVELIAFTKLWDFVYIFQIGLRDRRVMSFETTSFKPCHRQNKETWTHVSQVCHTGICFCREAETYFTSGNNASRVEKTCVLETCFLVLPELNSLEVVSN